MTHSTITRDVFSRHVRDALANFYCPAHLQVHPLVSWLNDQYPMRRVDGPALREMLQEAIEELRPPSHIPFGQAEWLPYRVLLLHYIECREQAEICAELGIGRTTFYRCHREGLDAVTDLLWRRGLGQRDNPQTADHALVSQLARREAARIAVAAQPRAVSLAVLIAGVRQTIAPLLGQRGIELRLQIPEETILLPGDLAIWRQVLLTMLTVGCELATGGALQLSVVENGAALTWQLAGLDHGRAAGRDLSRDAQLAPAMELLAIYGGRLWIDRDAQRNPILCFSVPKERPPTILIVDNDEDTIQLFRRYLAIEAYEVVSARSVAEAWDTAQRLRPTLVLLDVLMPQEDGWAFLQRLKSDPSLADTPVIVCSVLSQPQLALALGARAVLQKPVAQAELLDHVRSWAG
ncbi:MAG: response regulator [Chloroflexi bacterium]|nr:response regulator [Chloroflexota bacterium]